MSKRYALIDEIIARAEQILEKVGTAASLVTNQYEDTQVKCGDILIRRSIGAMGRTQLTIRCSWMSGFMRDQLVLELLGDILHHFVFEEDWVKEFDKVHAQVMAQSETKDGAA